MAWLLGFLGFVVVGVFGFGLYEFYVDNKHDSKIRSLHLKHLEDINHERK